VAQTANGSLAQEAASLANDSALVSMLGAGNPFGATYDAAGLFNVIAQAGTPNAGNATQASPSSLDQQIVNSLTQPNSASTALAALAATVPAGTIDQNSSYAAILKQSPAEASTVIAESTAQGIISTISTWA
jgi:hypothetical protein